MVDQNDRVVLSTIDSFMARSVQALAFELGIGGFEILEQGAQERQRDELLQRVFDSITKADLETFYQTLKQATLRSKVSLRQAMAAVLDNYRALLFSLPDASAWGGGEFWMEPPKAPSLPDWRERAAVLATTVREAALSAKSVTTSLARSLEWLAERNPGRAPRTRLPGSGRGTAPRPPGCVACRRLGLHAEEQLEEALPRAGRNHGPVRGDRGIVDRRGAGRAGRPGRGDPPLRLNLRAGLRPPRPLPGEARLQRPAVAAQSKEGGRRGGEGPAAARLPLGPTIRALAAGRVSGHEPGAVGCPQTLVDEAIQDDSGQKSVFVVAMQSSPSMDGGAASRGSWTSCSRITPGPSASR